MKSSINLYFKSDIHFYISVGGIFTLVLLSLILSPLDINIRSNIILAYIIACSFSTFLILFSKIFTKEDLEKELRNINTFYIDEKDDFNINKRNYIINQINILNENKKSVVYSIFHWNNIYIDKKINFTPIIIISLYLYIIEINIYSFPLLTILLSSITFISISFYIFSTVKIITVINNSKKIHGDSFFILMYYLVLIYFYINILRAILGFEQINHPFEKFHYQAKYEVEYKLSKDGDPKKGIATIFICENIYNYNPKKYNEIYYYNDYSYPSKETFRFTFSKEKLTIIQKLETPNKTYNFDIYDITQEKSNTLTINEYESCIDKNEEDIYIKLLENKIH